ncbi:MAG: biliverdin-producing heme oxygenase [Thermosynechococcus sp. Uc]|uniref:biliverdin-producing heme oxygenase n=1 Tax=Thermosynechococcus sp. Uc TaxID=3034853 RepID=UPI0019F861A5|nr:biliverdin-producing heme oxygenase [Thermosynechococcus sp. Uc]MDM7326185.1 biliverdin-producing heme oxygenase [Thermosynechococcus sp. Uc]HIK25101.1 biliverdin-producing heme oxygenase [Thermosynechococcus sp. M46_R2017_013]
MTVLSLALREGTAEAHTLAEHTAFMKCFVRGFITSSLFRQFLANLYFVYTALEAALATAEGASLRAMYFPELNRSGQLAEDLAFYYGDNWQDQITPLTATRVYLSRIHDVAKSDPLLLIAHSYTRYMGDLSGGQALSKIVRSHLTLPEGKGTAFYEFPALPTPEDKKAFKQRYRETLDGLGLDGEAIARIVKEANFAFALNCNLMHALEPELKATVGDQVWQSVVIENQPSRREHPRPEAVAV